ncbi:MAG: glucose-1-phosphate adenylyltransferase [Deltaproteobacteria bacterium]|nr:glucose-1-phosphate adenylyltransferase [Deltaproteobacteria bacterium]
MKARFAEIVGRLPRILGVVLAGGEGRRLLPLTTHRAKPAVPFGGPYRIVDFVLSNFVNSGIHRIKVLTQYKSDSLLSHLARGWRMSHVCGHYVEPVPAQQRVGKQWFLGSADALHQSMNIVHDEDPDFVCVFGGDHIYKIDVRQMLHFHIEHEADLTVAAIPIPREEAKGFGIIEVDKNNRMIGFEEKPDDPKEMPSRPGWVLASMGNYIFDTPALENALAEDAIHKDSAHDFGRNILPMLYPSERVFVYDFTSNQIPGTAEEERGYWRDVGTIEAYWSAHMDLVAVKPVLNLYNPHWPIRGYQPVRAPAKFVFASEEEGRVGMATDSLVSPGCIISGGQIDRSVLAADVRVNSFAKVDECVVLDYAEIGRYCKLKRVIVDKGVKIPPKTEIGYDRVADAKRFHVDEESGIVIVPKGYKFEAR